MTESYDRQARAPMPNPEREKQDRRIVRAIRSGLCLAELLTVFQSEAQVRRVAKENGLTIARGRGGRKL